MKLKQQSFIILLFSMHQIGVHTRRKSYAHAQPCLPRKIDSSQSGTRTIYKQLPSLSQELKSFRRKMLFESIPSVQTLPQITRKQSKNGKNQNTRYSSKLSSKYHQTLMTMGSETETRANKSIQVSQQKQEEQKQLQDQNQLNNYQMKLNIDEENRNDQQNEQNQENNYNEDELQGYTMGNKINQAQQSVDNHIPKMKSFAASEKHKQPTKSHFFIPRSQEQAMMQYKYLQGKYKFLRDRHEDQEFLRLLNDYKKNKQNMLKQLSKKHESMRALSLIKKVNSLPKLSHGEQKKQKQKQIQIPTFQEFKKNPQDQQSSRSILNRRLECSMSFGKLQIINNANKNKNVNYQQLLQQQLTEMMKTQRLLRDKGITFDVTALKNSFLNIRNTPTQVADPFCQPRLLSNPYEIKQKIKKRR